MSTMLIIDIVCSDVSRPSHLAPMATATQAKTPKSCSHSTQFTFCRGFLSASGDLYGFSSMPAILTMNAFNELRAQARDNRDKAIGQARDDYSATLVRIAELEQDLLGRDPPKHKSTFSHFGKRDPLPRAVGPKDHCCAAAEQAPDYTLVSCERCLVAAVVACLSLKGVGVGGRALGSSSRRTF